MAKKYTLEELAKFGISERNVVDRSTHPLRTAETWDVSQSDEAVLGSKGDYHYPHIRPQSVLIAPIGQLWEKDAWWHLQDMMLHTAMAGHSVSLHEMKDDSLFSFEAIPMMRWSASMMARDSGVDWLLMVDNDVLLEKDTLLRLLAWDRPIVFPLLEPTDGYPVELGPLSQPGPLAPKQGLVPVRWAAMSVMLLNPRIFNVLDSTAWRGSDYLFGQALNFLGHRIYVDTDTPVKVVHGPTRHAGKGYKEFWEGHKKMYFRLRHEPRDRQAPPGFNPATGDGFIDKDGTYYAVPSKFAPKNGKEPHA